MEPGSERAEPAASQSAQVLLPDDLWAILTGETRPANRVPEPEFEPEFEPEPDPGFRPEPEIVMELEEEPFSWRNGEYGESAEGSDLADPRSRDPRGLVDRDPRERVRELAAREGEYRNRSPREDILRGEREIVSLEDTLLSDDERHDAFHQRLDASAPGARGGQATASRAARQRRLRRAIILREVLGPPRGLEDPF
jgi:hypothetical protein